MKLHLFFLGLGLLCLLPAVKMKVATHPDGATFALVLIALVAGVVLRNAYVR